MVKVTAGGLARAARNLLLLPVRLVLLVFEWFLRLSLLVIALAAIAAVALGVYYYQVKSNQPMVIDPRYAVSLPPEGMTFRELWQDRFAGWKRIDEYEFAAGISKSRDSCRFTRLYFFPQANVLVPTLRVLVVRFAPDSRAAHAVIAGAKGQIAPADLNLVDAIWWQIENETWWYWVDHQAICRLPPPKRPQQNP